jgi:hypothetical protein
VQDHRADGCFSRDIAILIKQRIEDVCRFETTEEHPAVSSLPSEKWHPPKTDHLSKKESASALSSDEDVKIKCEYEL